MTDSAFEALLIQALLRSARQSWEDLPSAETLRETFPDTASLDKKIRRLEQERRKTSANKQTVARKRFAQWVALFLLSLSLLFGALMLQTEARRFLVGLVTSWYEDHITYSIEGTEDTNIPTNWTFAYLPKDFSLVLEDRSDSYSVFQYQRADGAILSISMSNESSKIYKDNEHYEITQLPLRDGTADLYHSKDNAFSNMIVLYSEKQHVLFNIFGDLPMEELIKILEHIRP